MPKSMLPIKHMPFYEAIKLLGGTNKAAIKLKVSPAAISHQLRKKKTPPELDLCARIEKATKGAYTLLTLRPDIAKLLKGQK